MEMKDRIARIIEAAGITRSEFARKIKVAPASVTQMCSGRINPSPQTIEMICREFNVAETWLRYGTGDMAEPVSREEEITHLVGQALKGSNEFKLAVIRMICSRSDSELQALEAALRNIYEQL